MLVLLNLQKNVALFINYYGTVLLCVIYISRISYHLNFLFLQLTGNTIFYIQVDYGKSSCLQ